MHFRPDSNSHMPSSTASPNRHRRASSKVSFSYARPPQHTASLLLHPNHPPQSNQQLQQVQNRKTKANFEARQFQSVSSQLKIHHLAPRRPPCKQNNSIIEDPFHRWHNGYSRAFQLLQSPQ